MPRQLIFEKDESVEALLATTEVSCYFFIDYYEMPGGMFFDLEKSFPAGSISREQLQVELEKEYEENIPYWKKWDEKCNNSASICLFIGYFDKDRDFHVVAEKMYDIPEG